MAEVSRCCWRCLDPRDFPRNIDSTGSSNSTSRLFIKPPNIFCRNLDKQAMDKFKSIVDPTLYTLYALSDNDWNFNVWQNSTHLLIISDKSSTENQGDEIMKVSDYLVEHRGKVLLLLSDDCGHSSGAHSISSVLEAPGLLTQSNGWIWRVVDGSLCLKNEQKAPVMVVTKRDHQDVTSILALLGISCAQQTVKNSDASATTLYTCKPPDSPDAEIPECLIDLLTNATGSKVEIVCADRNTEAFSFADYFAALKQTSRLGRHPFWSEEMSSNFSVSQKILPKLPDHSGLVIVSAVQTAGVGRRGNQWLSPRGAALFTAHLDLPFSREKSSCYLPHLLAWIQHLPALAVFLTLNELLEACGANKSSSMELRVKWPNDVYAVDRTTNTCTKVSGVLASASCTDPGEVRCLVGIGVNVANSKPTTCLHDLIKAGTKETNAVLPSVATVRFESGGSKEIEEMYTSAWMHKNQRLKVPEGDRKIECTVVGVDKFGYLRVVSEEGEEIVLHPNADISKFVADRVLTMYQASDYVPPTYEYMEPSSSSLEVTQQQPQQQMLLLEATDLEAVDLDAVQKINDRMAPSNPKAPVCSNKNPLRLIQQGDRFITTQKIKDSNLKQIIEILANDALVEQSKDGPSVFCFHNRNANQRILLRLEHARTKSQQNRNRDHAENAYSEAGSHSSLAPSQDGTPKRRRGRRPGRKNKTAEEEDPDFEPDLPIEEVLPFPIIRKKAPVVAPNNEKLAAGRVSKPPKYLIKDYKHLRLEDLKDNEEEMGGGGNGMSVLSDDDSNVGYSDYDDGLDSNSDRESGDNRKITSLGFDCDKCDKSFSTRAGLSRHKMLKHNPNGDVKRVGPWSDPALSALRRRNRLKEALEKATPDDIADIAAPMVAKVVSMWNYLLLRTEATVSSPPSEGPSRTPPSPPEIPSILKEYLGFVDRFREFFNKHVEVAGGTSADLKTVPEEVEMDEEEAVIMCGGPAPASVKRRRYLRMKKRRKLVEAASGGSTNLETESATNSNASTDKPIVAENPSKFDLTQLVEENGFIRVRDQSEASVLGVEIGRYKPVFPLSEEYLPRRYGSVQREQSPSAPTPKKPLRRSDPLPKRALITTGEQIQPAQTIFENTRRNEEEEEDSEPILAPDPTETGKPDSEANAPVEQNFYLQAEGVGHSIPDEWVTSGAFIPVAFESGALSDLVVEAGTGRIFHRPTGQLVSMSMESDANGGNATSNLPGTATVASVVDTESAPQEIYVSNISPTVCLITTPSGARYHVEHGGEGVTTETIQAILRMNGS
ncbi:Biotin--protein ligase [Taenia crassiceps]|uniref:Biotin--protein ligase n=1 Tax=Taenia crassiceps TaxID=6207 RepID=A0ABR4Q4V8_9CEST